MVQIKTVTTGASEQEIGFNTFYRYVWIKNTGAVDCYASGKSGIEAGADDVVLIKAGEYAMVTPDKAKIFIKGATTLEIHAQSFGECPFIKTRKGGGGSKIVVESLTVDKNGTYTAPAGKAYSPVVVDDPNTFTQADEGKVIKGQKPTAQTSRTVTENGTYDTTTNNSVVVACEPELMSRSDWSVLSTAQKQAKGLVAIQDTNSGYSRGELVNGEDYHDTLLIYSDYSNILEEDKASEHESGTNVWGGLALSTNMSNVDGAVVTDSGVISYALNDANTSVTIYGILAPTSLISGSNRTLIGVSYSLSMNNCPNLFVNGSVIYSSVFGSDVEMAGVSASAYHIFTLSIDATNKRADFYIDGKSIRTMVAFSNSGQTISFSAADTSGANQISTNIKYIGIVGGYEDAATILKNQAVIMQEYGLAGA